MLFSDFGFLDFGNIPVVRWNGPTAGGFSLNGDAYVVPHGLDVDGDITLSAPSKAFFCNIFMPADEEEEPIKVLTFLGFDQIDFSNTVIASLDTDIFLYHQDEVWQEVYVDGDRKLVFT